MAQMHRRNTRKIEDTNEDLPEENDIQNEIAMKNFKAMLNDYSYKHIKHR